MNAEDVKDALRRRHGADSATGQWVCIDEAFCGWKSSGGGVDLLAIGVWSTAKAPGLPGAGRLAEIDARHPVVAYEVKVSRSDFRREVNGYRPGPNAKWNTRAVPKWPGKAWWALERSHYFAFAVPKGLLHDHEIERRTPWDEVDGAQLALGDVAPSGALWLPPEAGLIEVDGRGCAVRVAAPLREARPLTVPETAELLRHGLDPNSVRKVRAENAYLRGQVERLQRLVDAFHEERAVA